MKTLMYLLIGVFFTLLAGAYMGIGWVSAWVLDIGLNVDVKYSVFVLVAFGVYVLSLIPIALVAGSSKLVAAKLESMDKIVQ